MARVPGVKVVVLDPEGEGEAAADVAPELLFTYFPDPPELAVVC